MFHQLSKHLEFRQKYSAARQLSSQCLDIAIKHCLSCLIYYIKHARLSVWVHFQTQQKESCKYVVEYLLGTFRSEDEEDYYEYEFSVLIMRTSKNVGLQTLFACSVLKTRTRSRPRPPISRSLLWTHCLGCLVYILNQTKTKGKTEK